MKKVLILLTAAILCMKIAGAAQADGYPMFDFDRKTVTLNSGYEMPILGLGMFSRRLPAVCFRERSPRRRGSNPTMMSATGYRS